MDFLAFFITKLTLYCKETLFSKVNNKPRINKYPYPPSVAEGFT